MKASFKVGKDDIKAIYERINNKRIHVNNLFYLQQYGGKLNFSHEKKTTN